MPQLILPAPSGRSPTAGAGSDYRDDNVYSAGVLAHGGTGTMSLFTVPKGQSIPELKGSGITATTADHQTTYTDLTTNLNKAGELGNGIGDIAVRAIGVNVESSYDASTYGAGERELKEIQSKVSFVLKVGQKDMIKGPVMTFGSTGGIYGSLSTTKTDKTLGLLQNGSAPRRLKMPILIDRGDTVEGVLGVAGSTGLSFTTQSGIGNATLVWVHLFANVRGDVR